MPGPDLQPDLAPDRPPSTQLLRPNHVDPRSIAQLARLLGVRLGDGDGWITGVTHDSRAVQPGDLYAALPGAHAHGAQFAAQARTLGAAAVLTDPAGLDLLPSDLGIPVLAVDDPRGGLGAVAAWVYGEPTGKLRLLGVTGTNGKTTTSYLIEAGLRAAGERTGLIGTVETRVGPESLRSVRTTPEATELQAVFALMVERGVGAAAMEVSSHALALHRVDGTVYDVAAFTNLSQDHLDFHETIDNYFAAKARLFTPELARAGVVNRDDPYGRRLLAQPLIPLVAVSAQGDPAADWRAVDVVSGPDGSTFRAVGPDGEAPVRTALPGAFNVANALLALATLVTAGFDLPTVAAGVGGLSGVPGRMEPVRQGQPFAALVDYAHTPDAVVTLLDTLRATTAGRLVVVLGCGGDRDRAKRPLMGAAAARLADVAVLTSDNPRSEDPAAILAAVTEGAMSVPEGDRATVIVEPDRARAIALAVAHAGRGDVVVVAGKGHEQGQEVGGVVHPFDDRVVLREALAAAGWSPSGGRR